jgi:hypothetical protein
MTRKAPRPSGVPRGGAFVLALTLLLSLRPALFAQTELERRQQAGVRLFRSLLAADLDLPKKTADGKLLVVFFYTDNRRQADAAAAMMANEKKELEKIREFPVVVETTNDPSLKSYAGRQIGAVFIAQSPGAAALRTLIRQGIEKQIVVYSPFEGHVETGVLGGISVEAQVRPYVNRATLEASHISLKPFFLKVTKVYQ